MSLPRHENDCQCSPTTCLDTCALQVIDGLLAACGTVRGEEVDALLDLRSLLRRREDRVAAIALFSRLRRSMEARHYLAFYRLRRWMDNHFDSKVELAQ